MKRLCLARLLALAVVVTLPGTACAVQPAAGSVHVLTARGQINPVMANYLVGGIRQARAARAGAVLLQLDTPGGLDSAMRDIVQAIDGSAVPVIVYVSPAGARAASAGTFITLAGHVAAMAPNTAIGAAHPVGVGGQNIESRLDTKVENDAVAYIRGIAELRGRNAEWAEQAVRASVSVSERQALELHVVDLVEPDITTLLRDSDGRTVRVAGGSEVRLHTADAPTTLAAMSGFEHFLLVISDPNIAFLLLNFGVLALLIELSHPTLIVGLVGAVALVVGLFALGTLPVNWVGVALLALAFALLGAELFVGGHGALGVAGVVAMAAGGLLLTSSADPGFQVSRWLVVLVPAFAGAGFGAVALVVWQSRRRTVAVGAERLIGAAGTAGTALAPDGFVVVYGERWQASAARPIAPGEAVIVTGREGLHLLVRPAAAAGVDDSAPR